MNQLELCKKLLQTIRRLQRSNKSIGSVLNSDISLNDSILLIECQASKEITGSELSKSMCLNKSTISRMIEKLGNQGYLEYKKSAEDLRVSKISITPRAEKLIADIDSHFNKALQVLCESLSAQKLTQLVNCLHKICDQASISPGSTRQGEHIFRNCQRRLAKLIGTPNNQLIGNKISILDWHILSEINENETKSSNSDLVERLAINKSVISLSLKKIKKNGLISVKKNNKINEISLTKQGIKYLSEIKQNAASHLLPYCAGTELEKILPIFEMIVKDLGNNSWRIDSESILHEVTDNVEKTRLRSISLTRLVELGWQESAPETIMGTDQSIFLVRSGNTEELILQFDKAPNLLNLTLCIPINNENKYKNISPVLSTINSIYPKLKIKEIFRTV